MWEGHPLALTGWLEEILSNVVYGVMAHPRGLLGRLLVFRRFDAVHETDAADDFGQLFGPI
jgi:hypothetical protein